MPTSNLYCLGGRQIVVDCGLGVTKGLVDHGMQLKDLTLIFVTHPYADHYLELGPLLHIAWTVGLKTGVEVYGPPGLDGYWDGFVQSMRADIDLRIEDEGRPDLRDLVGFHLIAPGVFLDHDGLRVDAICSLHPPLVDCFALSFRTPDLHVVFSGDTAPLPALVDFARGADLLIHEAMLASARPALLVRVGNGSDKLMAHWLRSHSFAHDAAQTATDAGVARLALTYLIPSEDPDYTARNWTEAVAGHWNGPLFVGHDGLRIELKPAP